MSKQKIEKQSLIQIHQQLRDQYLSLEQGLGEPGFTKGDKPLEQTDSNFDFSAPSSVEFGVSLLTSFPR